jgi:hypothetical protein
VLGAAANVVVTKALVPEKAEPVMVPLTAVLSVAWLLGCHDVVTTPPDVVKLELGVKVVVAGDVGYAPLAAEKVTDTPGCAGDDRVAVTVMGADPAVYDVGFPVTTIDGAVSA